MTGTRSPAGSAEKPDIIAIDGGSTDSGPHYLGTGTSKYSANSTKAEWRELMAARREAGVPLLIGTAGTCGADDAVDWLLDITREIAAETGERLKVAVLKSGQPAARVAHALGAGKVTPLVPAPEISPEILDSCTNIVALAGAEHIQGALETGADIVIAGRTTDTAIISALPLARGCNPGGAWHGAKIGECGALATTSPNSGTILIDFDADGFTMTPMGAEARATPHTVSAHMLYENSDPYVLYEPGGHLDVTEAVYTALDDRRVRVTGSKWIPSERYTVKLEGARQVGYQYGLARAGPGPPLRGEHPRLVRRYRGQMHRQGPRAGRRRVRARTAADRGGCHARGAGRNAQIGTEVGVLGIVTAETEAMAKRSGQDPQPLPAASPAHRAGRDAHLRLPLLAAGDESRRGLRVLPQPRDGARRRPGRPSPLRHMEIGA